MRILLQVFIIYMVFVYLIGTYDIILYKWWQFTLLIICIFPSLTYEQKKC